MPKKPKIIILSESYSGQKLRELTEPLYRIGRVEGQDIVIPDTTVSSQHCELVRMEDGGYFARDLGSSNGTRINGARITEQTLSHSDILQVGGIEVLYHSDEDVAVAPKKAATGINLEDTAGGLQIQEMSNVNPFSKGAKKQSGKLATVVMYLSLGLLALLVLYFAGKLVLSLL